METETSSLPAGELVVGAEQPHDLEPDRVAERVQHIGEMQLLQLGVRDYAHRTLARLTPTQDSGGPRTA